MEKPQHILVVDDDQEIRQLLQAYLEQNGYRVTTVGEGKTMNRVLEDQRIDLVVLDLMLPGTDGLELCRNLRVKSRIPIIMLTARGDEMDRILGLEMGADDYLPKPFNPRELLARIKVVLRRSTSLPYDQPESTPQAICFDAGPDSPPPRVVIGDRGTPQRCGIPAVESISGAPQPGIESRPIA